MLKQLSYKEFLSVLYQYKEYFTYIFRQVGSFPKEGLEFYSFYKNIGLLIGKDLGDTFIIYRLEINSKYRRRHYGMKFLKKLFLRKRKKKFIVTYLDDVARLFYLSLGFKDSYSNWHQMYK